MSPSADEFLAPCPDPNEPAPRGQPIDLAGLKKNPPDRVALKAGIEYLELYFQRKFPTLREDWSDLANQTLEECLPKIMHADHAGMIITHGYYLGLATLEARRRLPSVSIEASATPQESWKSVARDPLNDPSLAAWEASKERLAAQERFDFALVEVIPQLPKKDQDFIFEALEFFRQCPEGGWADLGLAIGKPAGTVRVTMNRIRAKVNAILERNHDR
jgi:hypothetical protein